MRATAWPAHQAIGRPTGARLLDVPTQREPLGESLLPDDVLAAARALGHGAPPPSPEAVAAVKAAIASR